jgi:hypothetical protein
MGETLCPLRKIEVLNKMLSASCHQARCAWWITSHRVCAMTVIATAMVPQLTTRIVLAEDGSISRQPLQGG